MIAVPPPRAGKLSWPRVLLCDLDGTLVDTMPALTALACDVLGRTHALPRALARELYVETCGMAFEDQLQTLFPDDPRNATAVAVFERQKLIELPPACMTADTRAALVTIKERGVRIAISSSNGQANVAAFAAAAGFPFDLALGHGPGMRKGRAHVDAAMRAFGGGAAEMTFVGDSIHDGDVAAAQGVGFVALAGTFSHERLEFRFPGAPVIDRFADLPGVFG